MLPTCAGCMDELADLIDCAAVGSAAAGCALRASIDSTFLAFLRRRHFSSLEPERAQRATPTGRMQTAQLMRSRSPTMLSVTLRQLQRGAALGLADCFRMELGMAAHSFEQGDFLEGVRAVLIDKDNHRVGIPAASKTSRTP